MQFAEPTDRGGAAKNSCCPARPQTWQRARLEAHRGSLGGERKNILHICFHVVEIERLARTPPLLRPACTGGHTAQRFHFAQVAAAQLEFISDLKEPHA